MRPIFFPLGPTFCLAWVTVSEEESMHLKYIKYLMYVGNKISFKLLFIIA